MKAAADSLRRVFPLQNPSAGGFLNESGTAAGLISFRLFIFEAEGFSFIRSAVRMEVSVKNKFFTQKFVLAPKFPGCSENGG